MTLVDADRDARTADGPGSADAVDPAQPVGTDPPAPGEEAMAWDDVRRQTPVWRSADQWASIDRRLRFLIPLSTLFSVWYLLWLLVPQRVGNPYLFSVLVGAQIFNFVQGIGFWWTCWPRRGRPPAPEMVSPMPEVDILIPVYTEPLHVVAPTVAAATAIRGGSVHVYLLDDAGRPELAALAERWGAHYIHRDDNYAAKAGNLNHALGLVHSPFVAVFDCDHVPEAGFLEATMGWMEDPDVALVQTPQYYSNANQGTLAAAAASQQDLFFGPIARGKDTLGAMICCGTNFVIRRTALDDAGGFPEQALTEDFALSIRLHESEWRTVYVNEVLARGLGPEDMSNYVSQQLRWSRGCLAAIGTAIRARLPFRLRLQYLHASSFFLTGWTILLYVSLPAIRILTGAQPFNGSTSSEMLLYFAPYYAISLVAVAAAGGGSYTFEAYCLFIANFWIQIVATVYVVTGTKLAWVVTSKEKHQGREPGSVIPALVVVVFLGLTVVLGFVDGFNSSVANNMAFALLYAVVITVGMWPALSGGRAEPAPPDADPHFEVLVPALDPV
jgi:cellulose synthase (UDP-forming)